MRQGSDQPLSVTTGLYGRPFGGTSGGAISGVSRLGASGSDAAPARDTIAAPNSAAAEPPRNVLREVIGFLP
jgi:hypothetical protein